MREQVTCFSFNIILTCDLDVCTFFGQVRYTICNILPLLCAVIWRIDAQRHYTEVEPYEFRMCRSINARDSDSFVRDKVYARPLKIRDGEKYIHLDLSCLGRWPHSLYLFLVSALNRVRRDVFFLSSSAPHSRLSVASHRWIFSGWQRAVQRLSLRELYAFRQETTSWKSANLRLHRSSNSCFLPPIYLLTVRVDSNGSSVVLLPRFPLF